MINKVCIFCQNPLSLKEKDMSSGLSSAEKFFDIYLCRDCQQPKYKTLYRQLYYPQGIILLADAIKIDEFYINRYHQRTVSEKRANYSILFKDIPRPVGYDLDVDPINITAVVSKFDSILELPFDDLKQCKNKLNLYTTFS